MYFWIWNRFSKPFRCKLENTARDQERFLLPPPDTELQPTSEDIVEKLEALSP